MKGKTGKTAVLPEFCEKDTAVAAVAFYQIDCIVLTKYENSFCLHNFSTKLYTDRLKQTSLTCLFFILLSFSACCIKQIIDGAINKLVCKVKTISHL